MKDEQGWMWTIGYRGVQLAMVVGAVLWMVLIAYGVTLAMKGF